MSFHRLCHQARSSFCLGFGLPFRPVPWTRAQPARLRRGPAPLFTQAFSQPAPSGGFATLIKPPFAALFESHRGRSQLISLNRLPDTVQSAAFAKPRRRRRTRRRASQELNQEAGTYRTAWMVMNS